MKYIRQFTIILFLSLAGEILHLFVPLPVPASIYGLLILLFGLKTKWIPLEAVEEASTFLIDIMPLMFIPAAVGLLDSWGVLRPILIPFLVITLLSTVIVMVITGKVTQFFIKSNRNRKAEKDEQCSK
ncbi:CidA/LrgA family protein [Lacrimispora saccharolytica]|uniref:LrgA family protein n=1 Tax=Lacrimispora saccharolytica (strain ATCC 35040 / DSM 2544 / NRCC 2533 / WM1) TaxID=610130 RepID=D9R293_LACSW|nr:CidA/LrgA family protein [Lacrimispora saccharolytica]ADL04743.1 LrgA family protein [[Clostridium] saccharolyticum WM1]QRV21035.1 CidA/LrgA family protein [Lacrimispora saccharolytica]